MTDLPGARSFVTASLVQLGYSHDTAETLVQRALDEHSHELAERIRKANLKWEDDTASLARDEAADLIDPDVTS